MHLLLQVLDVHAVRLHLYAHQLGAVGPEGVQHAHEGKLLAEDGIALVQQHLGRQVRRLLAAGDGDELVGGLGEAVFFAEILLQGLPQGLESLGKPILQHGCASMEQGVVGDGGHLLHGEGVGGGIAPGEADHIGSSRHLEQLTNDGSGNAAHAVRLDKGHTNNLLKDA